MHAQTGTPDPVSAEYLSRSIRAANDKISARIVRTPVIRLPWLDSEDREVWAKLECHQLTGSFKYRGAYNSLRKTKSKAVITASAGNHALVTAAAGASLGERVHLVAPVTASELKASRMVADAEVSLLGQDLYDATKIATEPAASSSASPKEVDRLHYVSPYDDVDVAAGAGTIMSEVQEDHGSFDAVVMPLGGGGLAAAVGAWCSVSLPACRAVCSHPEIFSRKFGGRGRCIQEQLAKPTAPSYSDGLAVQLVGRTAFGSILRDTVDRIVQVSEEETAVAISMALRLQSLLVEGAAATTTAAVLNPGKAETRIRGRALLTLTGGNISSSSLARSLVSEVAEAGLRRSIGLRNILPSTDRHGSVKLPISTAGRQASQTAFGLPSGPQPKPLTGSRSWPRTLGLENDGWCEACGFSHCRGVRFVRIITTAP